MPVPECYVICLDVKVRMVCGGKEGDTISQYVKFTKGRNEQTAFAGKGRNMLNL